jgi:hypothetical protein
MLTPIEGHPSYIILNLSDHYIELLRSVCFCSLKLFHVGVGSHYICCYSHTLFGRWVLLCVVH